MLHIVRPDGKIETVEDAVRGVVVGDQLICQNDYGEVIKIFGQREVLLFGTLERVSRVESNAAPADYEAAGA